MQFSWSEKCSTRDGMWFTCLASDSNNTPSLTTATKQINYVNEIDKKEEIIKCPSASMWNKILETWIKSIEVVFFATWLELTSNTLKNHLQRTMKTDLGHLHADRKNVRSTNPKNIQILLTKPRATHTTSSSST